jgi:hypothetical protein
VSQSDGLRSGNGLIRLHHEERHCWIGEKRAFTLGSVKDRPRRGRKTISPKNAPTYVTEDMEEHTFVCPASRCTYGFTGHVTKAYVSDSNEIIAAYLSV